MQPKYKAVGTDFLVWDPAIEAYRKQGEFYCAKLCKDVADKLNEGVGNA